MLNLNKREVELQKDIIIDKILKGAIFIHPTDTIYGLGCDATNSDAVKKIRDMKEEHKRPFSVIAPNKTWIRENCEVNPKIVEWLTKLPGPYTLILKLKNKNAICKEVILDKNTLAVRIPEHWIHHICEDIGKPIITTSANKIGSNFMVSIETLDTKLKGKIDFIIYEGEKQGKPSDIINLSEDIESINKR
jgi:L-threonylcarbamoyladenylate synthase